MLAPLGTLVFLASLWLIAAVIAELFSERSSRILAALRGEPRADAQPIVSIRRPMPAGYARRQPLRVRPQLRAAA